MNPAKKLISLTILSALLSPICAVRAQIALHSRDRQISASTHQYSGQEFTMYNADDSDGTSEAGNFTQSFTQGGSLEYCQVHTTLSQQTSLAIATNLAQFGGGLHINTSVSEHIDDNGAGAISDYYTTSALLSLEISDTVNFTLTATASNSVTSGRSTLVMNGDNFPPVFIGYSPVDGGSSNTVNLRGTLAPGQYTLEANVGEIWGESNGTFNHLTDCGVNFQLTVSIPIRPRIDNAWVSGTNFIGSGSGGVTNGTYYLLSSTNVAMHLSDWLPLATNGFDANGHFTFTNAVSPAVRQRFYIIKLP